jgi:hypothetical protein
MLQPMGARTSPVQRFAARNLSAFLLCAAAGCLGCDSADAGDPAAAADATQGNKPKPVGFDPGRFDEERAWSLLERIVAIGPRPSGTLKNGELRNLIEAELKRVGLAPVREPFQDPATPIGKVSFENLYADVPGSGAEPPIVVIATHFDTKRVQGIEFLGANDGGSGTAVLLELARALAGAETAVTWRLLFLDGEEAIQPTWVDPDNRYGSRHHVARLEETGELARVKAMVLLDMVGDEDLRFETDTNSTRELLRIFFDAAHANGMGKHVDGRVQAISDDHLSFLAKRIPSADLIDLDYGEFNEYWHTADDTLEHCSRASLGVTGRIVLFALPAVEAWVLEK